MATKKRSSAKRSAKKSARKPAKRSAKKSAKKSARKSASKSATKRKPNPAFARPLTPSPTLAAIVGSSPLPRTEVIKKLWAYIKRNGLQDSKNRRAINADDKLRPFFGGKSQVTMFDLAKLANKNLS